MRDHEKNISFLATKGQKTQSSSYKNCSYTLWNLKVLWNDLAKLCYGCKKWDLLKVGNGGIYRVYQSLGFGGTFGLAFGQNDWLEDPTKIEVKWF